MSCDVTEPKQLAFLGGLPALLVDEPDRSRAATPASAFDAVGLRVLLLRLMCSRFLRLPALAESASFWGSGSCGAYPSETSRTSPRRPTFVTSSQQNDLHGVS